LERIQESPGILPFQKISCLDTWDPRDRQRSGGSRQRSGENPPWSTASKQYLELPSLQKVVITVIVLKKQFSLQVPAGLFVTIG
jgi:hypothetical protein